MARTPGKNKSKSPPKSKAPPRASVTIDASSPTPSTGRAGKKTAKATSTKKPKKADVTPIKEEEEEEDHVMGNEEDELDDSFWMEDEDDELDREFSDAIHEQLRLDKLATTMVARFMFVITAAFGILCFTMPRETGPMLLSMDAKLVDSNMGRIRMIGALELALACAWFATIRATVDNQKRFIQYAMVSKVVIAIACVIEAQATVDATLKSRIYGGVLGIGLLIIMEMWSVYFYVPKDVLSSLEVVA